jgi:hypothetical protein
MDDEFEEPGTGDSPEDLGEMVPYVFCVERYRQAESTYGADDYFVDGLVLVHLPLPLRANRAELESAIKKIVLQLQSPEHEKDVARTFPKFHSMRSEVALWWYHLMRKEHKERLPRDFHTNQFTEEELLGIVPEEDPDNLPKEMWFDRDGDPIEGPPDRVMALVYGG